MSGDAFCVFPWITCANKADGVTIFPVQLLRRLPADNIRGLSFTAQ